MPTRHHLAALVSALLLASVPAVARTVVVAVNGVDSFDCGTKQTPCRSVRRGIELTGQGDTVVVGPGRYGDLARDGNFTSPGDEAAEIDTGCDCMIHVDKRLTIVSRDGAGATVLDAGGASIDVVALDVAGTVFGQKGKGFTLTGGGGSGLHADVGTVTIAGNVAVANARDGLSVSGDHLTVADNRLIANGGFGGEFSGSNDSMILRNVATDNGDTGLNADNHNTLVANFAARNGSIGIVVQSQNTLAGNVAVDNVTTGFRFDDGNFVTGCLAHGNQNGFELEGQNNTVTKSSVIANNGVGIIVRAAGNTVSKTNLFGNAGGAVNVPNANFNCGTLATGAFVLIATQNFWGVPAGPGDDPADRACNGVGGTTTVAPVATKEIKVKAVAAR
jgi:hypothetical protein